MSANNGEYIHLNLSRLGESADPQVWAEEFVRVTTENDIDPLDIVLLRNWFALAMEAGLRDGLWKLVHGKKDVQF